MTYGPTEFILGTVDLYTPEEWYAFCFRFIETVIEHTPEGSPFNTKAKEVLGIRMKGGHINKKVLLAQKLETIVAEAKLLKKRRDIQIEKGIWLLCKVYWPEDPKDAYFRAANVHRTRRGRFGKYRRKDPKQEDASPTLFPVEERTVPGCLFPGTLLPRLKRHRTRL